MAVFGDALTLESGARLDCDVCIVGGGAAGITLARRFAGSSLRVLLLESGGRAANQETQELYRGESVGIADADYLRFSRLRYFGGTTNHWGGGCIPLEPLDFACRSWVPHSGWPISRDDLSPFYLEAQRICGLGDLGFGFESWSDEPPPDVASDRLVLGVRKGSVPPVRFGIQYGRQLERQSNVEVLLNANVTRIETDEGGRQVSSLQVTTLAGTRFQVGARVFVLACGGIENARLLLASDHQLRGGIGNQHDLVGRFFMEHPVLYNSCLLTLTDGGIYDRVKPLQRQGQWGMPFFGFRPAVQESQGMLNAALFLRRRVQAERAFDRAVSREMKSIEGARGGGPESVVVITSQHEQAPNPDSRVTLGEERDALGIRLARLDWRMTELDAHSLSKTFQVVAGELGRHGAGRLRTAEWMRLDPVDWNAAWKTGGLQGDVGVGIGDEVGMRGGFHQMGTTRMALEATRGVVDPNCRVHGLANLYVAGSSVFPTGGWANPTLTIVALALRLSDHLRGQLAG